MGEGGGSAGFSSPRSSANFLDSSRRRADGSSSPCPGAEGGSGVGAGAWTSGGLGGGVLKAPCLRATSTACLISTRSILVESSESGSEARREPMANASSARVKRRRGGVCAFVMWRSGLFGGGVGDGGFGGGGLSARGGDAEHDLAVRVRPDAFEGGGGDGGGAGGGRDRAGGYGF